MKLGVAMPAELAGRFRDARPRASAPAPGPAFAVALSAALREQPADRREVEQLAGAAGADAEAILELAALLRGDARARSGRARS